MSTRVVWIIVSLAAGAILAVGAVLTFIRFTQGLEATTNLTHDFGWGLWIGFDVLAGVALATAMTVLESCSYSPAAHSFSGSAGSITSDLTLKK